MVVCICARSVSGLRPATRDDGGRQTPSRRDGRRRCGWQHSHRRASGVSRACADDHAHPYGHCRDRVRAAARLGICGADDRSRARRRVCVSPAICRDRNRDVRYLRDILRGRGCSYRAVGQVGTAKAGTVCRGSGTASGRGRRCGMDATRSGAGRTTDHERESRRRGPSRHHDWRTHRRHRGASIPKRCWRRGDQRHSGRAERSPTRGPRRREGTDRSIAPLEIIRGCVPSRSRTVSSVSPSKT
jgi:hypothetical protein